jgi:hypothetical protein
MILQHFGEIIVLLVSIYVALVFLCNQGVEWLIISYNTLIIIRVTNGAIHVDQNDQIALQCVVDQPLTLECLGLTI